MTIDEKLEEWWRVHMIDTHEGAAIRNTCVGHGFKRFLEDMKEIMGEPKRDLINMGHAAEMLWSVVANASGGDWTKQSDEWQKAAIRWRDHYHSLISITDESKIEAGQRYVQGFNHMVDILYVGEEVLLGKIANGCEASWDIEYFKSSGYRLVEHLIPKPRIKPKLKAGQRWRKTKAHRTVEIIHVGREKSFGKLIYFNEDGRQEKENVWDNSDILKNYERLD